MTRIKLLLLFFAISLSFFGKASHVMGGELTWTCQGGSYVFQLVFYRDCNGAVANTGFVNVKVWNHPTLTNLQLNFVSQEDISPDGTEIAGGPQCLECGSGANSGNGPGAIEKITYRSNPLIITGTPPAQGWIFTYEDFSRNHDVSNLQDPDNVGITIAAKMFPIPGATGNCVDNSPQFLQEPFFVACSGFPYEYNMNAVDPDLDSLYINFGIPYNNFSPNAYNPPVSPAPIAFVSGYSASSPTPGPSMDPGNIPAQINSSNGTLTFLSYNAGGYNIKLVAQSFRYGQLIAEVEREIQVIVSDACVGNNNPPIISGPFGGLFETTVDAGTNVNFTLSASDVEFLQDGTTPQRNFLSASGLNFGTNYILSVGCPLPPCATLNNVPIITMTQGASVTFNWNTDCSNLETPYGLTEDIVPYHFVFKVQDDYCPIPKVTYATITVNVRNPGIIQAPEIDCMQSDINGDLTISWNPVNDPMGTFTAYQLYSSSGLVATINDIATGSFTIPAVNIEDDYYLAVASGCNGNSLTYSETISNIFLDVINPSDGTAFLTWNAPATSPLTGMGAYYHIMREYPAGTWSLYDSVPYATTSYIDTITICSTHLNYQIVLPNDPCNFSSNIDGDDFVDMMTPAIPVLGSVSIDTLTNEVNITWDQNTHPDTYGYIIYGMDGNGVLFEMDTVWGITNTGYSFTPPSINGPMTFSVAAFDSCWTVSTPATYQTSAKGEIHTTMFMSVTPNTCTEKVLLEWSPYVGWNNAFRYEVFAKSEVTSWTKMGETTTLSSEIPIIPDVDYCIVIKAVDDSGNESFSNVQCLKITAPRQPAFNYLSVATVAQDSVLLKIHVDASVSITELSVQRKDDKGVFQEITRLPVSGNDLQYYDGDVEVQKRSYTYRVQVVDSCGRLSGISNEAETILLYLTNDELLKLDYLSWSPYRDFDGSLLNYSVYRIVDSLLEEGPIAVIPVEQHYYTDDINEVLTRGKICYYVEAIEALNTYSFSEISRSNITCITLPPVIYIPNAFWPDGINKIFLPIVSDIDPSYYELMIFDRWGRVIFETNDYREGWTGTINFSGEMAETGTYLYVVKLRDGDGIEVLKHGHVSLLR